MVSCYRPRLSPSNLVTRYRLMEQNVWLCKCTRCSRTYLVSIWTQWPFSQYFNLLLQLPCLCSWNSVVRSQYSDWLLAGRPRGRSLSPGEVKNFYFSKSSRLALGSAQIPIQWVPGAFSLGVKRPGREVDHSPPTSADVKKMWIYTSTPYTPSWRSA
jgi:hypothetical protein